MGTIGDWLLVFIQGGFWWIFTIFLLARSKEFSFLKPTRQIPDVVFCVLAGLLFGIVSTFSLQRATHRPLVFVTAPVFAGLLITGGESRRGRVLK
jgi:uncharacterized membrane protein